MTVAAIAAGERLDKYLAEALPDLSRAMLQKLIKDGAVLVGGKPAKPSYRVEGGDTVIVRVPPPAPLEAPPAPHIPLDILYQDTDLLVLNKPAGLVVHPAHGHSDDTLVNALLAHVPDLAGIGGVLRPGIVHRLDKDTSGLLLVAKHDQAQQALQDQFRSRAVDKVYLALVEGHLTPPRGRIDAPIGRDPRERQRMAIVPTGRPAQTEYRVLETLAETTLVEAHLLTGRTHQIRVHLASLGYPIVGDRVYGHRKQHLALGRQFLHAWRLAFTLPSTGERIQFTAPLPVDLRQVLEGLGSHWQEGSPLTSPST
ncbi:MAG: RluA family pseudouridine synthase [Anaerolineae bacterium]|nr:RluA family pseudouridine synthase [Anaerolineae bacterium]